MKGKLKCEESSLSVNQSSHAEMSGGLVLGYYNLRGKGQVPRLLLQYLGVEYEDKLFTIHEWQRYITENAQDFTFGVLPFLREGRFVVTDSVPICTYIINRFGPGELLGRNLRDRAIIQMYMWTIPYMENVISINCQQKSEEELRLFKLQQWRANVYPRLIKLEQAASDQSWFLGYLTLIDFSIYELVRYMENIFEKVGESLPKLKKIERQFGNLPVIKQYEVSQRAITEWCPTKLLESMKSMNKSAGEAKSDVREKQANKQQ